MPTVILFDIDGTLIDTGGAGRRALTRAFETLHGSADCLDFCLAGMTDPSIVRKALNQGGHAAHDEAVQDVLAAYLSFLCEEVQDTPAYTVHPGVTEILDHTCTNPQRFAVGLGTGNIENGAQIKLARGQLDEHFAFGGYGSDSEDRGELLRIGAGRGAHRLGVPVDACRVVVIGDTPRDVAAAQQIGAECVAVATGPFSTEELRQTGAPFVFEDLSNADAMQAVTG